MIYLTGSSRKGLSEHFGYLASPQNRGTAMLIEGRPWGGDCGAFTGVFDEAAYFHWLARMQRFQDTCLFVVVPDVVCNAAATLAFFRRYAPRVREMGFPIALVAQNGLRPFQEGVFDDLNAGHNDWRQDHASEYPEDDVSWWESLQAWKQTHICWEEFDCLFIGGDIEWKLGEEALRLIEFARKARKHVHVGRVNTRKRLRYFQLAGAHSVDGNALKFFDDNYPMIHHTLEQPTIFERLLEKEWTWQNV
jgi:hypothetical protein